MASVGGSLGIGSGILTSDIIDQLKAADESTQVKPITTKYSKAQEKQTALSTLQSLMITTKSYVKDFSDELTYLGRNATSSSSDVSLSVIGGTSAQSGTINVSQLAQNDIWESKGFAYNTSLVNSTGSSQTMKITVGSTATTTFNINVSSSATLTDLKDAINNIAGDKVTASIVNTGDATNPYRLVIKGDKEGAENKITIDEGSLSTGFNTTNAITGASAATNGSLIAGDIKINGYDVAAATISSNADLLSAINNIKSKTGVTATIDGTGKLVLTHDTGGTIDLTTTANGQAITGLATQRSEGNHLQAAQDAKFVYNGMSMSRSSNTITDVAQGLTITLNAASSKNISLSVSQDLSSLSTMASSFVSSYNSMVSQLDALTKYTKGATSQGIFVGVSEISSIESDISSVFTNSVEVNSKSYSLMDFGFSLDKDGQMKLDSTVFNKKLNDDPSLLEKVFRGSQTYQNNSYNAKMAVTTTDASTKIGDIAINGVQIAGITTLSTNTAEQNGQLFADAINKVKSETGVSATVGSDGKLRLTTLYGGKIQLATTTNGATLSGLSADETTPTAITNSMVAIGSSKSKDGIFTMLTDAFDLLFNDKSTGSLDLYDDELTTDMENFTTEQEKTQSRIDSQYDIMTRRFEMYDAIIADFKQQASTITQLINSASSS